MNAPWKLALLALAVAFAGCSDDDPADSAEPDLASPSIVAVTAIDYRHIELTFDEPVTRETAERSRYYSITDQIIPGPVETIDVEAVALWPDQRTVTLTTWLGPLPYKLNVTGVSDLHGNRIETTKVKSFQGVIQSDQTAPKLVYQSPAPGATDVGISPLIIFQFTEATHFDTLTLESPSGNVRLWLVQQNELAGMWEPALDLLPGTQYTVHLVGAQDEFFNVAPDVSWSFTTGDANDTQAPTLVSSNPADGAVAVNPDVTITLTFSERMRPVAFFDEFPFIGPRDVYWSSDGKTLRIDPYEPLPTNQQYAITISPSVVADLHGNENTNLINIRFTTGSALASGSIAGTIGGDPESDFALDPTGAIVVAPTSQPGSDFPFGIVGSDVLTNSHLYAIDQLPDGYYYLAAYLNANDDGWISGYLGDPFGAYGMNILAGDDADYVTITAGSTVTDIDFALRDPSAVWGWIEYEGIYANEQMVLRIGLYDSITFDPELPPDVTTLATWPWDFYWIFSELYGWNLDGTYFAGAFLDVNEDGEYDMAAEPVGFYGGESPIAIRLENGNDASNIPITLHDPVSTAAASARVKWPAPKPGALSPQQVSTHIREAKIQKE